MTPPYLLIAIAADGRARCSFTSIPVVPPDFTRPGEIAFVVQPLDVDAIHAHGPRMKIDQP